MLTGSLTGVETSLDTPQVLRLGPTLHGDRTGGYGAELSPWAQLVWDGRAGTSLQGERTLRGLSVVSTSPGDTPSGPPSSDR